jgi:hypothetical protein
VRRVTGFHPGERVSPGEAHRPEPPVTAWAALELLLLELTEEDEGLSVAESVGAVVAAAFAVEPLLLVAVDVLVVLEVDGLATAAAAVPGWAYTPMPKVITPMALSPPAAAEPDSNRRRRRAWSRAAGDRGGRGDCMACTSSHW